jgi:glycine C-acetyltransferase
MLYDAKLAGQVAARLLELGVYVVGFCYPWYRRAVPDRTQISAAHTARI